MFEYLKTHPEVGFFALYVLVSAVGAVLPENNRLGQWCRKFALDLKAKHLPVKKEENKQ